MKKIFSMILTFALTLALLSAAMPASADIVEDAPREGDFAYYLIDDGTAALLYRYYGEGGDVVIPSTIAGVPVTKIGEYAFDGCQTLTGITIPATVTSVSGFSYNTALESITVEEGNPVYHSDGNCLIETATKTMVLGCKRSVIPTDGSVTCIRGAFSICEGLTEIIIPDTVTEIGLGAFAMCTALTSVTIPDSVTRIGDSAFYGCSALTELNIPESVTEIDPSALYQCAWYDQLPDDIVYINHILYGFKGPRDYAPKKLEIREGTEVINGGAFYQCKKLTSVTIPNTVKVIGGGAFQECEALTEITISKSVTEIQGRLFAGTPLTSLTVEEGNPVYHSDGNCLIETESKTLLEGIATSVIPTDGSVTSIANRAFLHCGGLLKIDIPDGVTAIGDEAFDGCKNLKQVTMANTVTDYGDWTFAWCKSLISVTLSDKLTRIGAGAFYECQALTSIDIPESVTEIGGSAFYDCTSLAKATLPSRITRIGDKCFYGCSSLTAITIPDGVTEIGFEAFQKCWSMTRLVLPASVTKIDYYAFYACGRLQTIYYGGTEADKANIDIVTYSDIYGDYAQLASVKWVFETAGLPVVAGDASGNGELDMKDVLLARQFIAGWAVGIYEESADMNSDQSVDMKDVLLMRRSIAGGTKA